MEWVSVKDRLPETTSNYGQYIVAIRHKASSYTICAATYRVATKEFGEWHFAPKSENDRWLPEPLVTHWMPFPEAPKEDADDTD